MHTKAANKWLMKSMSSQQLDLFNDYALDMQNQQAAESLAVFFEATGIYCSAPLVYGEDNPICQKEVYVPTIQGKNVVVFYQIIGNLGGYANKEYLDDTNVVMLPDDTIRKLEQGVKDDVVLDIEKRYNKNSIKFQNIQFTCESDFIDWVKHRTETSPDRSTQELLEMYGKG